MSFSLVICTSGTGTSTLPCENTFGIRREKGTTGCSRSWLRTSRTLLEQVVVLTNKEEHMHVESSGLDYFHTGPSS